MQKLFDGVARLESFVKSDATEKLDGVKSFPLPDLSLPRVAAVVAELSLKSK